MVRWRPRGRCHVDRGPAPGASAEGKAAVLRCGERETARAAIERLKAKLAESARQVPPVEMKSSMPDAWSVKLFVAVCRRYGLQPYRYVRQCRTTVMVRVPRAFFDAVVWQPFSVLYVDLLLFFEETTDGLSARRCTATPPRRRSCPRRWRRGEGRAAAAIVASLAAYEFQTSSSAIRLNSVTPPTMRARTSPR